MEETKLGKYTVLFSNRKEYRSLKKEIWNQEIYYFETENPNPFIIDIGSHIGLSILYFKSLYPNCNILSFEPNPISFEILKENIYINGLKNINLINKAISSKDGIFPFYIDSSNSNWHSNSSLLKHSWSGRENTKKIEVECTKLDGYIEGIDEIDMLKIDTEGTELNILKSNIHIMSKVKNISIEYHPIKSSKIGNLISILEPYFSLEIYSEGKIIKKSVKNKLLTIKGKIVKKN